MKYIYIEFESFMFRMVRSARKWQILDFYKLDLYAYIYQRNQGRKHEILKQSCDKKIVSLMGSSLSGSAVKSYVLSIDCEVCNPWKTVRDWELGLSGYRSEDLVKRSGQGRFHPSTRSSSR